MAVATAESGSASPSSSPRLPSPPPFPEVQAAPQSPIAAIVSDSMAKDHTSRRIRPGTRAADMAKGPPLVPLSELNSPFQLQEYLKALHHKESHDEEGNTRALDRAAAVRLATPPDGVERSLWLYELCRLLLARVNVLIVGFFNDHPKCSATNCPEMRASEWQYLCAVHDPPKSCCAIDYCCHTLDWATNIITSQKHFPSRLTLGGDVGASQQGLRQLTNIFRRVYRMFAHAWFQHREVFWQVETTEGLYAFYKTVCEVYSLMPADTYTVPPEAEGSTADDEEQDDEEPSTPVDLPLRPAANRESVIVNPSEERSLKADGTGPTATKRHRQTPSTGSFVPPITEADEDGDEEAAAALSTVRYDPVVVQKSVHGEDAMTEATADDASEITTILDDSGVEEEQAEGKQSAADEDKSSSTDSGSGSGSGPTTNDESGSPKATSDATGDSSGDAESSLSPSSSKNDAEEAKSEG